MVVKHELPSKMLQRACSVEVYLCIFAQVNVVQVVCIEVFKVIRVALCSLFLGPLRLGFTNPLIASNSLFLCLLLTLFGLLGRAGSLCNSFVRCWRSNNRETFSEDGVGRNAGIPI